MTRTMKSRSQRAKGGVHLPQQGQDERMGHQDSGSITTTMGVVRTTEGVSNLPLHQQPAAAGESPSVIPRGLPVRMVEDDDDVSVLTECSGMMEEEEEEDASSQVTAPSTSEAWTVVTSATDSTTIPTRNTGALGNQQRKTKRRHGVVAENPFAYDNSAFKRRRKR